MSWAIGSPCKSGGMYSLYMPWLIRLQEAPVSVLAHIPAVETPIRISAGLRGGASPPPVAGGSPPAAPPPFPPRGGGPGRPLRVPRAPPPPGQGEEAAAAPPPH